MPRPAPPDLFEDLPLKTLRLDPSWLLLDPSVNGTPRISLWFQQASPPTPGLRWVIRRLAKSAEAQHVYLCENCRQSEAFFHNPGRGFLRRRMTPVIFSVPLKRPG